MNYYFINANTDLGVHVNGSNKGPKSITNKLLELNKINKENIINIDKPNIIKSLDKNDKKKNLKEIITYNNKLYLEIQNIIKNNYFPITLGGDHTVAISSALASNSINKDLGIIWIDAHTDFNTLDTTITGNIHGLPLAAIANVEKNITPFTSNHINKQKIVIIGARAIDKLELEVLKENNIKFYTTHDLKEKGIKTILDEAFKYINSNVHISYDLDIIDPILAPGVSVPEINGININEAYEIIDYLNTKKDLIKSFDLVEYNPDKDINNKTLDIAINILDKFTL